jgi:hypothetical protein
MLGVDQHSPCGVTQVFDSSFGDAILMMSAYATEGKLLVGGFHGLSKGFGS